MKLNIVSTVLLMACISSALIWPFFVTRAEASFGTVYVDARNTNDPLQDGSSVHPFNLIQEGVDAAVPGDTVDVAAGVYYEGVQINKSSISLVGQKGSTIIDGNGTEPVGIRIYRTPPDYTENLSISGFTVRNCVKGITLSRSIYIRLRDNSMVSNSYNFGDYTLQVQDIDTSNTVDGKPIYFWVNQRDKQVPADAGFVDIVDSTNITVSGLNLTNNVQGLVLKNTTNSLIEDVHILNNWDGMYLDRWSNSNTIIDSTVSDNLFMGIYVSTSSSNVIENNSILNNSYGLFLDSTAFEYTIGYDPTSNIVRDNVVRGNTVANSSLVGFYSIQSEDNVLYDNNFLNNAQEVYSDNSTNVWDDGSEGNYWQDYSGQDLDRDGFGDTPYVIDANNQDNHPLMGLFSDFAVTWQEETYRVTAISNSTILEFYFSQSEKTVGFSFNSPNEGSSFCRVTLPTSLLGGPYTFFLDGLSSTDLLESSNGTHCFLYFAHNNSYHDVRIVGTSVIPEFSSFLLVFFPVVLAVGVAIVALARRRLDPALSG
jgi:parallel beta-helix repeat protein